MSMLSSGSLDNCFNVIKKNQTILVVVVLFLSLLFWPTDTLQRATAQETDAERRTRIEQQLQVIEREMLKQQVLLEDKQLERQSLERDVNIINAEIRRSQLGIEARAITIASLMNQIEDREATILILNERLERQRKSLAKAMRQTQSLDDFSLVEVLLSNQNFSEFFVDVEGFRAVKESLNNSLMALGQIKADTERERELLTQKQTTEAEMKRVQELERERIRAQEAEKRRILTVTRGQEQAYQAVLQEQQKTASQLRAQLFELLGGGGGIPFPEAVDLAQRAGRVAGVSPALILAILEQETNYGAHLGSCVYNDVRSGNVAMHPDRDAPVFMVIAETLGFDPMRQQVSCPLVRNGQRIGWGGAMGPSQFIPSTWAIYGGYVNTGNGWQYSRTQDAIRTLLGKASPSNPFNNQDAFTATALLLRDNGASANPRLAALRYYAGWGGASNPANQFYGDQVMQRMQRLENEIRVLGGG